MGDEKTGIIKNSGSQKGNASGKKKKPFGTMLFFGAVSLTGYIILMANQAWVNENFTMGGWHAAYPVVTALIFSFVHGAFASNLLSVLGIEAKKH